MAHSVGSLRYFLLDAAGLIQPEDESMKQPKTMKGKRKTDIQLSNKRQKISDKKQSSSGFSPDK